MSYDTSAPIRSTLQVFSVCAVQQRDQGPGAGAAFWPPEKIERRRADTI